MESIVLSNVLHRKTRTLASVAGVGLGVVLIVLTVGLVHGFLDDLGRRNSAVTAEILLRPPGGPFGLNISSSLTMPIKLADELRSIDGVESVVPVGQFLRLGRMVDGIDFDAFSTISDIRVVEGRSIRSGDEIMIDRISQRNRKLKVGDKVEVFERGFDLVGIYEPESLARVKIPLATLQADLNSPGLCSMMFIKVANPSRQEEIASRIKDRFPEHGIWLTRQLPSLYARGTPAFQTFLDLVIGLAVVVSSLVILLAMYTTVTERTRQIGVLKSLGASRAWIAAEIEKEALLISIIGIVAGVMVSIAGKYAIERFTTLNIKLEALWFGYALLLGLASGMLGAIYPALRAANQDPVTALSYE